MTDKGIFLEPGEGRAVTARGSEMVFKALHETTDGAFSFMERELPVSNRRRQPHRHEGPEGFYVLDGSIEFVVGGESRVGGPNFWALAPRGVARTFGNAATHRLGCSSSMPRLPIGILPNWMPCGARPPLRRLKKSVP